MHSWHLNQRLVGSSTAILGVVLLALASGCAATAQGAGVLADVAFSAPSAPDLPIILEGLDGRDKGCAGSCMQILLKTEHPVIINGVSYRRLEGAACNLPEHAESVREFVLAGYLGACAESTAVANTEDLIFVQATHVSPGNSRSGLLPAFAGLTMQAIERRRGTERILGRRTCGSIASLSIFSPLGFTMKRVGTRFDEAEFLQQLLGVPMVQRFNDTRIVHDASIDTLIGALRPQLDLPDQRKAAAAAIVGLAEDLEYSNRTVLIKYLLDFLRGGGKGQLMAAFGMLRDIPGWSSAERDASRPRIVAALQSEDTELVASALDALRAYSGSDRVFANPHLIALCFSPVLRGEARSVRIPLVLYLGRMKEAVPPADRERAKDLLLQGSLTEDRDISLLALLAQGGGSARTEAFAVLQRLDQLAFEQGAAQIGILDWKGFAGDPDPHWSDAELKVLFARMDSVPDERLETYMAAFGSGSTSKETRRKVADRVQARIAAAEGALASPEDTKPLKNALAKVLYN